MAKTDKPRKRPRRPQLNGRRRADPERMRQVLGTPAPPVETASPMNQGIPGKERRMLRSYQRGEVGPTDQTEAGLLDRAVNAAGQSAAYDPAAYARQLQAAKNSPTFAPTPKNNPGPSGLPGQTPNLGGMAQGAMSKAYDVLQRYAGARQGVEQIAPGATPGSPPSEALTAAHYADQARGRTAPGATGQSTLAPDAMGRTMTPQQMRQVTDEADAAGRAAYANSPEAAQTARQIADAQHQTRLLNDQTAGIRSGMAADQRRSDVLQTGRDAADPIDATQYSTAEQQRLRAMGAPMDYSGYTRGVRPDVMRQARGRGGLGGGKAPDPLTDGYQLDPAEAAAIQKRAADTSSLTAPMSPERIAARDARAAARARQQDYLQSDQYADLRQRWEQQDQQRMEAANQLRSQQSERRAAAEMGPAAYRQALMAERVANHERGQSEDPRGESEDPRGEQAADQVPEIVEQAIRTPVTSEQLPQVLEANGGRYPDEALYTGSNGQVFRYREGPNQWFPVTWDDKSGKWVTQEE